VEKIRILIVDDDVISRKLLRTVLETEPDVEVVGLSSDGERCLTNIPLKRPDLVTLDIEMPGMDGIETLKRIRAQWPHLPVIMYSGHTEAGAAVTLEALSLGASDYVTKPQVRTVNAFPLERLREDLMPKIRALCPDKNELRFTSIKRIRKAKANKRGGPIEVVAIAISTGGPNVLGAMIPELIKDLAVPVLIVQHIPSTFSCILAERLNESSEVRVVEGQHGQLVQPGTVYIAPGGFHMTIERQDGDIKICTNANAKVNSCRPAADVLFNSLEKVYGGNVLTMVLTGMGGDGAAGAKTLSEAGSTVLIQDEASSVVWGMPGAVAQSGIPNEEIHQDRLAHEINSRVRDLGQSQTHRSKSA
jgi:two-component system chemotaxis response regulator CheB